MKLYAGFLFLLALSGCWSRPCCVADQIPAAPCKAEGDDAEGWRIASGICRNLEAAGAEVQQAYVKGTHLSLKFAPKFRQKLLADESALRENNATFLSLMSKETGSSSVSVVVFSGDQLITILDENYQGIGSMTMPTGTVEYIEKKHKDMILAGSTDVKATKVGFTV